MPPTTVGYLSRISYRSCQCSSSNAPVNKFDMPCNADRPIDLLITSDPPAKFSVHREIRSKSGPICHCEADVSHGSAIDYVTSDQRLIIEAFALNNPTMTVYLDLDWNHLQRTKKTMPNQIPSRNDFV